MVRAQSAPFAWAPLLAAAADGALSHATWCSAAGFTRDARGATPGACATLTCPHGTVIDAITSATFGEFTTNSSCTSALRPTARCATAVAAQAALLCRKRETCAVSCGCDAEAAPPCACRLVGAAAATVAGALAHVATLAEVTEAPARTGKEAS